MPVVLTRPSTNCPLKHLSWTLTRNAAPLCLLPSQRSRPSEQLHDCLSPDSKVNEVCMHWTQWFQLLQRIPVAVTKSNKANVTSRRPPVPQVAHGLASSSPYNVIARSTQGRGASPATSHLTQLCTPQFCTPCLLPVSALLVCLLVCLLPVSLSHLVCTPCLTLSAPPLSSLSPCLTVSGSPKVEDVLYPRLPPPQVFPVAS